MRAKALGVVVLLDVDHFFRGRDRVNGHVVVAAAFQNDQAALDLVQDEIQSEVAESHGNNGVNGVGLATAHQVAQFLVDHLDLLALVIFRRKLREFFGDQIADAPQLSMAKRVRGFFLEDHFAALEHGAFRNQNGGVMTVKPA